MLEVSTPTTADTQLAVVNPVAEPHAHDEGAERFPPAKRPDTLDGKVIGLYWNGKQNGLDALARAKENLSGLYSNVRFIDLIGELGGTNRYLSPGQLESLALEVDAVVATTADCGSCCSWLMRDLCELERRGVPAVGYTASIFTEDALFSTKTFGVPEACPVIVPECFSNKTTEQIYEMVDDAMAKVIEGLTQDRAVLDALPQFERMVLEAAPELVFGGEDLMDAFDNMQDAFVANGWSDGLPLVPPTHRKVEAMIAASGRDGSEVVGLFAPGFGIGTVRKIAANAVMAGCRPETMPVIMAMMDCVLEPSIGLRTWAMSTGPQAPVVMVSGSIADEIGMNHGICALGPGFDLEGQRGDRPGPAPHHDERRPVLSGHQRHGHHRDADEVLLLRGRERGQDSMEPLAGAAGIRPGGLHGHRERSVRHDRVLRLQELGSRAPDRDLGDPDLSGVRHARGRRLADQGQCPAVCRLSVPRDLLEPAADVSGPRQRRLPMPGGRPMTSSRPFTARPSCRSARSC